MKCDIPDLYPNCKDKFFIFLILFVSINQTFLTSNFAFGRKSELAN